MIWSTCGRGLNNLLRLHPRACLLPCKHPRHYSLINPLPLHEALRLVEAILDDHVGKGRLLTSKNSYCFPAVLNDEEALLKSVTSGFGNGYRLIAKGHKPGKVSALLATDSEIKIITTDGETPPRSTDLMTIAGKKFGGVVVNMGNWNTTAILQEVRNRQDRPLVVFVEEPIQPGDFGRKLNRLLSSSSVASPLKDKVFEYAGRRLKITKGNLNSKLNPQSGVFTRIVDSFFPSADTVKTAGSVIYAPWLTQEEAGEVNWKLLAKRTRSDDSLVSFYRPVPWKRLLDGEWSNLGIFAASTTTLPTPKGSKGMLRTIRHGQAWFFTGPADGGLIPVKGLKHTKKVSLEHLKASLRSKNHGLLLVQQIIEIRSHFFTLCQQSVHSRGFKKI